ncbi:MAG: methyltransferase domain-containing protein [bacterium]
MTTFFFIILLLLLLMISTFAVLSFVFAMDSIVRGHDLPTTKKAIETIDKIIREHEISSGNFYDLGCGRGTLSLAIKRKNPLLSVYGVDFSAVRIFFAKMKALFMGRKINFLKKDILRLNLADADIVFTYLWYDVMPPLELKLRKELKKSAVVITNTSHFPNWKPVKIYDLYPEKKDFEKLFVYVKDL